MSLSGERSVPIATPMTERVIAPALQPRTSANHLATFRGAGVVAQQYFAVADSSQSAAGKRQLELLAKDAAHAKPKAMPGIEGQL